MSRFEPAREHRTELADRPAGCLRLVARVAAEWDGEWEADGGDGGRLRIPVSAGLHFGWVAGRVTVKPHAGGSEVTCLRYWRVIGTDCARCMAVCPYSHPDDPTHGLARWAIRRSALARRALLRLDDLFYGRRRRLPRREKTSENRRRIVAG